MADTLGADITLTVPDAPPMAAFVARPATPGPRPGLLLFQEAFGVTGHIRGLAGRFAAEGYVVIAPELFHRRAPGFQGSYDNFDAVRPLVQGLTTAGLEADIRAAHAWLTSDPGVDRARTHAVGFCMGGRVAFLANLAVSVRSTASFYGGGMVPEYLPRVAEAHGPALFFWGGLDQHVGLEGPRRLTDALRAAGRASVHVEIADANHAFFNDERPAYNPRAAREAWALTLAFFRE